MERMQNDFLSRLLMVFKSASFILADVQSYVVLSSRMHITAFSIGRQLLWGHFVICFPMCQWGAEGNGDLQTLICVLVARPRRCLTLSNPVPWQNWMVAYLGYTLRMRTLFCGWPIMVNDTHTRRRRRRMRRCFKSLLLHHFRRSYLKQTK